MDPFLPCSSLPFFCLLACLLSFDNLLSFIYRFAGLVLSSAVCESVRLENRSRGRGMYARFIPDIPPRLLCCVFPYGPAAETDFYSSVIAQGRAGSEGKKLFQAAVTL